MEKSFFTITIGDHAENHTGMQLIGDSKLTNVQGFTWKDFIKSIPIFQEWGGIPELYPLDDWINKEETDTEYENPSASILIVRDGVNAVLNSQGITDSCHEMWFKELNGFKWDTKYYDVRRQKVLNKLARHNVCFGAKSQKPDYENKKGTIISWETVPYTYAIYKGLTSFLGEKAANLVGEGNKYENKEKQGIGAHGDTERRKVAMWRIGASSKIGFRSYQNHKKIGRPLLINLKGGDMLFMSEKACGWDWKQTKNDRITWRHAAGCNKYISQIM